jgi:hypothetical protein
MGTIVILKIMGKISRRTLLENPGVLLAETKQIPARIGGYP